MNRRQFAATAPLALITSAALGASQPDLAALFDEWRGIYTADHGSEEATEAALARCGEIEEVASHMRAATLGDLAMKLLMASSYGQEDFGTAIGASAMRDAFAALGRNA